MNVICYRCGADMGESLPEPDAITEGECDFCRDERLHPIDEPTGSPLDDCEHPLY